MAKLFPLGIKSIFTGSRFRSYLRLPIVLSSMLQVNYYIIAPTANHYAMQLGTDGAFGSTLIGASSFAAIFAAFLYSFWYTRSSFRSALLFSSVGGLLGNVLYATAISYKSMKMALVGRILCGFASAEVANRQLISSCVSFAHMTRASALFVAAGAIGMGVGPFLAGVIENVLGKDMDLKLPFLPHGGLIINHITGPGVVMASLWLLELLAIVCLFREPDRINGGARKEGSSSSSKGKGTDVETATTTTTTIRDIRIFRRRFRRKQLAPEQRGRHCACKSVNFSRTSHLNLLADFRQSRTTCHSIPLCLYRAGRRSADLVVLHGGSSLFWLEKQGGWLSDCVSGFARPSGGFFRGAHGARTLGTQNHEGDFLRIETWRCDAVTVNVSTVPLSPPYLSTYLSSVLTRVSHGLHVWHSKL